MPQVVVGCWERNIVSRPVKITITTASTIKGVVCLLLPLFCPNALSRRCSSCYSYTICERDHFPLSHRTFSAEGGNSILHTVASVFRSSCKSGSYAQLNSVLVLLNEKAVKALPKCFTCLQIRVSKAFLLPLLIRLHVRALRHYKGAR